MHMNFIDKTLNPSLRVCLCLCLCVYFFLGTRLVGFPSGRSSRTLEEEKGPMLLRRKQRDIRTYRKWWVGECWHAPNSYYKCIWFSVVCSHWKSEAKRPRRRRIFSIHSSVSIMAKACLLLHCLISERSVFLYNSPSVHHAVIAQADMPQTDVV